MSRSPLPADLSVTLPAQYLNRIGHDATPAWSAPNCPALYNLGAQEERPRLSFVTTSQQHVMLTAKSNLCDYILRIVSFEIYYDAE